LHVEHGPFFRDPITAKLRELDVRASRTWSSGARETSTHTVLEVLVEVKSLRGYHVIFAPAPNGDQHISAQRFWLGDLREQLPRALTEAGVDPEVVSRLTTRFRELAYPQEDEMLVHDRVVDPPGASLFATAFRETNIGSEKELDASVLWKAVQGLNSVIDSKRALSESHFLIDLGVVIDVALLDGLDLASTVEREFARRLRSVTLFHPAVVVDARLWVSRGCELEETECVRFVMQNPEKWPPRWFDVVTRASFARWLDQLTTHYGSHLGHPRETIWRESSTAMLEIFEAIRNPNLEVELKVRDRRSDEPPKLVLLKKLRRRKRSANAQRSE
jgi:hypothetical protein